MGRLGTGAWDILDSFYQNLSRQTCVMHVPWNPEITPWSSRCPSPKAAPCGRAGGASSDRRHQGHLHYPLLICSSTLPELAFKLLPRDHGLAPFLPLATFAVSPVTATQVTGWTWPREGLADLSSLTSSTTSPGCLCCPNQVRPSAVNGSEVTPSVCPLSLPATGRAARPTYHSLGPEAGGGHVFCRSAQMHGGDVRPSCFNVRRSFRWGQV